MFIILQRHHTESQSEGPARPQPHPEVVETSKVETFDCHVFLVVAVSAFFSILKQDIVLKSLQMNVEMYQRYIITVTGSMFSLVHAAFQFCSIFVHMFSCAVSDAQGRPRTHIVLVSVSSVLLAATLMTYDKGIRS